jgi:tRNA-dihydrouridine synthase
MIDETGCDAVMIGRAASSNPWIFSQIADYIATGRYDEPSEMDRYHLLSSYFRSLIAAEMPDAIGKMKQFASLFTHGVRNGSELRYAVHHAHTAAEILDGVDSFFARTSAASSD